MRANDVQRRIDQINELLEVKQIELTLRTNRQKELREKQTANIDLKKQFLARIRLDIKALLDEINALKTELWGLQEIIPTAEPSEYVW